jgi:hypothetical protein
MAKVSESKTARSTIEPQCQTKELMFVGHYSVAFAIKRRETKIPLWLLFVAMQLLDFFLEKRRAISS